jgi:hypothetical protein
MPSVIQADLLKDASATKTLATLSSSAVTLHSDVDIKSTINASGSAPIYACRAWVNFDGTKDSSGSTSTSNTNREIRDSGNVSSVLRNGSGSYTINFTTNMEDDDYCCLISTVNRASNSGVGYSVGYGGDNTDPTTFSTSQVLITIKRTDNQTFVDTGLISVAIFR